MKVVNEISTRVTKDGVKQKTKLTRDYEGVTQEQLIELADRAVVIMVQAIYRTAGKIPAEDSVSVADLLKRERVAFQPTPDNLAAKAEKMTPEERAALIEKLQQMAG